MPFIYIAHGPTVNVFPRNTTSSQVKFIFLISLFMFQKNALIGGALTGALISAAGKSNRDKIVMDAITGGAVATAAEFLNYVT